MPVFDIRVATPADAAALLDVYAPYVRDTAITFEYEVPSVEEFANRIRQTLERYPYLVAVQTPPTDAAPLARKLAQQRGRPRYGGAPVGTDRAIGELLAGTALRARGCGRSPRGPGSKRAENGESAFAGGYRHLGA